MSLPYIPASPGYYVLTMLDDGAVLKEPIIAWQIENNRYGVPIVVDPDRAPYANSPILCPNGQVISPFNCTWSSEQDWIEDAKKNAGPAATGPAQL